MRDCCCNLTFLIEEVKQVDFTLEEIIVVEDFPYEGEYTVIPKRREQVLATKHKSMRDDVTVTEIPYAETSNPYGSTYIISPNEGD